MGLAPIFVTQLNIQKEGFNSMKINILLTLSLFLLFTISSLNAAFLKNVPLQLKQADGKMIKLYATGDEYYNWLHDEKGFTVKQDSDGWYKYMQIVGDQLVFTKLIALQDDPAAAGIAPQQNLSASAIKAIRQEKRHLLTAPDHNRTQITGTINNIVIFIRFADQSEFGESISTYNNIFNGTSGNNMQTYFQEVSYGTLNVSSTFYPTPTSMVVAWTDWEHPRAYYSPYNATSNTIGYESDYQRMIREDNLLRNAINGVSSQIPTSLNVDGNNDGKVDNVVFIIKGSFDDWAELLWPHMSILGGAYINNKQVWTYNFQLSEFLQYSGNGVLCHEMYHSLGAPDLYHYNFDGYCPAGSWDIMEMTENPPQHMGAYMKSKYGGWISNIPIISSPGTYTLDALGISGSSAYRINSPYSSNQYYVVEYRKKSGTFENSIPGSGLLVYRINTAVGNGNADGPPDEVYIYRPGGTPTANGLYDSANFSLETERTSINQYTNPVPFLVNGDNGGLFLHSIGSTSGNTISFTYSNVEPSTNFDGFEVGFQTYPWTLSGNANWILDNSVSYSGNTSAKSGAIAHNQSSSMQLTRDIASGGQISFFYKVSSEANYDFLKFYINGTLQGQWSGTTSWTLASYNISTGTNTFTWEYVKNGSVVSGSDCAWIDHISWPVLAGNPPQVPQNLSAVAAINQIVLNWDSQPDNQFLTYRVFRGTSSGESTLLATVPGSQNQYIDISASPNTDYYYRLKAVSVNSLESSYSNEVMSHLMPDISVNLAQTTVKLNASSSQSTITFQLTNTGNYPLNYSLSGTDNLIPQGYQIPIPNFTPIGIFQGHSYYQSNQLGYFPELYYLATQQGGYLCTISSLAENNFIAQSMSAQKAWIGLTDEIWEGQFRWTNGEPYLFSRWNPGEPNNAYDEDYTEINKSGVLIGGWNDLPNSVVRNAIMETNTTLGNSILKFSPSSGNLTSGSSINVSMSVYGTHLSDGIFNTGINIQANIVGSSQLIPIQVQVDYTPPLAVSGLSTNPSTTTANQVGIVWNANNPSEQVISYKVYRKGRDEQNWTLMADLPSSQLFYVDTQFSGLDSTYVFYRVVAEDWVGNLSPNGISLQTGLLKFSAPQNIAIQNIDNRDVQLTWSPVTQTIGGQPATPDCYIVYTSNRATPASDFVFLGITLTNQYIHPYVFYFVPQNKVFYIVTAYGGSMRGLHELVNRRKNWKFGELENAVKAVSIEDK